MGSATPAAVRTALRLADRCAAHTSTEVVRATYHPGGAMAPYDASPLQRRFRDADAVTANIQVNVSIWETTGRVLLGEPTDLSHL